MSPIGTEMEHSVVPVAVFSVALIVFLPVSVVRFETSNGTSPVDGTFIGPASECLALVTVRPLSWMVTWLWLSGAVETREIRDMRTNSFCAKLTLLSKKRLKYILYGDWKGRVVE